MAIYYLFDTAKNFTVFELDCEGSSKAEISVEWTKYPIESGANVSDFGYVNPKVFEIEGWLTKWPLTGGENMAGVAAADVALEQAVESKKPITMTSHYWSVDVVLDRAERTDDGSTGDAMRVKIKGHTVQIPSVTYATMPPRRMKRKVKRRAAPKKTGGRGAKKTPTAKGNSAVNDAMGKIPRISF